MYCVIRPPGLPPLAFLPYSVFVDVGTNTLGRVKIMVAVIMSATVVRLPIKGMSVVSDSLR